MDDMKDILNRDQKLWRQYQAAGRSADPNDDAPDGMALAAYLDGTLEAAERDRVEAWFAAAPERLDLLIGARQALAEPTAPAADSVVRRAAGLRSETGGLSVPGFSAGFGRLLALAGPFQPLGWVVVTGAVLMACVVGFELGRMGYLSTLAMEQTLAYDSGLGFDEVTEGFL